MKPRLGCKYFKSILNYTGDDQEYMIKLYKSLDSSLLDDLQKSVFKSMFDGFRILTNIKCVYFKHCVYTDGKYTLNVRRDMHNVITIMFDYNPHSLGYWLN